MANMVTSRQHRRKYFCYIIAYPVMMMMCVRQNYGWVSRYSSIVSNFPRTNIRWSSTPSLHSSGDDISVTNVTKNWRESLHPQIFQLPTIIVPNEAVHSLLRERGTDSPDKVALTPFLATHLEDLQGIHPRIKIVRDMPTSHMIERTSGKFSSRTFTLELNTADESHMSSSTYPKRLKLILLHPERVLQGLETRNTATTSLNHYDTERDSSLAKAFPGMSPSLLNYLESLHVQPGPTVSLSIPYNQQSVHKTLEKVLPTSVLPPPTGFEQIGHLIHLNLKNKHLPYRYIIGEILLDRFQPIIQTIVNKVGEVSGPFRTYDMEVLAGKPDTMVQVVEDGIRMKFDLSRCYWSTRLSGERSYLVEHEFKVGDIIVDAFCGVGALCLQAAHKLNATVYANDLNPDAVQYFQDNAKSNGIKLMRLEYPFAPVSITTKRDRPYSTKRVKNGNKKSNEDHNVMEIKDKSRSVHITCSDAFEFLQNVGLMNPLPNHIVMNYPLDSISFLGALRWWPSDATAESLERVIPIVHLYTFAHADDDNDHPVKDKPPPRDVLNVAIDLVADGLIPEGGALEKSRYRKSELNKLGCEVQAREVRDVAPGKVVVCISMKITLDLIRVMKGDYVVSNEL